MDSPGQLRVFTVHSTTFLNAICWHFTSTKYHHLVWRWTSYTKHWYPISIHCPSTTWWMVLTDDLLRKPPIIITSFASHQKLLLPVYGCPWRVAAFASLTCRVGRGDQYLQHFNCDVMRRIKLWESIMVISYHMHVESTVAEGKATGCGKRVSLHLHCIFLK